MCILLDCILRVMGLPIGEDDPDQRNKAMSNPEHSLGHQWLVATRDPKFAEAASCCTASANFFNLFSIDPTYSPTLITYIIL